MPALGPSKITWAKLHSEVHGITVTKCKVASSRVTYSSDVRSLVGAVKGILWE